MFGLRRAVISRNRKSILRQTWMCMPNSAMKAPSISALHDIAADDHGQHHPMVSWLERKAVG